jgi:hypothetical protein
MVICSHSDCGDRHKKVGYLRQSQSEEKLLNAPRICCSSDTPSPLEGDGLLDIAIGVACLRGDPLCKRWLSRWLIQTTGLLRDQGRACPTTPCPGPKRAGTEIREGTRELQMNAKGILMHIDRPDQIAVAAFAALAAHPVSASGLVCVLASGTPATRASFGAGEAQDASLTGLVGKVVDVSPVLPLGHAPVVVAAAVAGAHAVRVADEERAHIVLDTKIDDLPRGLVSEITHAPLGPSADFVLRPLELLPAPGAFLAAALLPGELSRLLCSLAFEGADTASGHDERLARVGGHGGQMDFPQVNGGLNRAGTGFRLWDFHADVQFEATVPHERTGPGVLWQLNGQYQRRATFAQWQHDAPLLDAHRLGGPVDGIERFDAPGVLHAHLRVFLAQFARGLDVRKESVNHHLYRLAMQGIPAFGHPLQLVAPRPRSMGHPSIFVGLHAKIPPMGRFHLRFLEAVEERRRQVVQVIHANCLHMYIFFLPTRKMVTGHRESKPGGSLSSRPLNGTGLPAPLVNN